MKLLEVNSQFAPKEEKQRYEIARMRLDSRGVEKAPVDEVIKAITEKTEVDIARETWYMGA